MAKLAPFKELTNYFGAKIIFDPKKVSLVLVGPAIVLGKDGKDHQTGPITHVSGVSYDEQLIHDPPDVFLHYCGVESSFVQLDGLLGPGWVKASSIVSLCAYRADATPRARCSLRIPGYDKGFFIADDVDTARDKIEKVRTTIDTDEVA
jgi:hypothetical protein